MFGRMKVNAILQQLLELQKELISTLHFIIVQTEMGTFESSLSIIRKNHTSEHNRDRRKEVSKTAGRHLNDPILNHLDLLEALDKEIIEIIDNADYIEDNCLPNVNKDDAILKANAHVRNFMEKFKKSRLTL